MIARSKGRDRPGHVSFSIPEPFPPQILFSPLNWKQSDSTTTMRTPFRSLRLDRVSKHLGTPQAQLKPFLLVLCRCKGHGNSHKNSSTRSKHGQKVTKHTSFFFFFFCMRDELFSFCLSCLLSKSSLLSMALLTLPPMVYCCTLTVVFCLHYCY